MTSRCGPTGEPTIPASFFEEWGLYGRPCYDLALEDPILKRSHLHGWDSTSTSELMSAEDLRGCLGAPKGFHPGCPPPWPSKTREFPGNFRMTE